MNPEQLFNQNFAAIQQAKQQTGDWEKAFQQVTGQKWPKGQNIKIDGSGGHMVKDNPMWKKVAKVALPVAGMALAPFTGGATMAALLGAGTGAAAGAIDGGWKGALKGGAFGAASGFGASKLGGLMNKIPGTTPPYAGPIKGGMGISDLMKNANVPMGKLITNVNAVNGKAPSASFWSKLGKFGKDAILGKGGGSSRNDEAGQGWADASSVLDGMRNMEIQQRNMKGNFTQNWDKLNLAASEENRNRETDALRKLAQTSYLMNGGAAPLPTRVNSGNLPNLGFGPRPASDAQKQGAASLQGELLKRLTPEGQIKPTDLGTYANPGTAENVGKWGSVITGGIGAARTIFGK